jgi:energy-coupling factor transporter ATP-binding protein EcfA2
MTTAIDFLKGYRGNNNFLLSLQKQFTNKGYLSPKQTACLELAWEKARKNAPAPVTTKTEDEKEETMATKTRIPHPAEFFELETETVEPATAGETPATDQVQEMLNKLFSATLAQWTAKLEVEAAKAKVMLNQQPIMKIRLGDGAPVKALTKEAHPLLPKILNTVAAGENVMLVGPAGSGKTTLAEQVAEALGSKFGHLSLSAGASESWLFGRNTPQGFVPAEFAERFEHGGVFLLDEMDAADANMLIVINTALANGHLFNPMTGRTVSRHANFVCIAGCNTFGLGGNGQYTGRNRLDAATLDRFVLIPVDYLESLEAKLCPDKGLLKKLQGARKKLQERNAPQIISTRFIARAHKLVSVCGYSEEDAIYTLTAAWPKGLAGEVGLSDTPAF